MSKTIKIMSDGNIAKVGMICAYRESKEHTEIGVIKNIKTEEDIISTSAPIVLFHPINAVYDWACDPHIASCNLLSKATPEQKKFYWLELEKQTIQFRPEFEAKLKELGIRDQFINNLFDPKWVTDFDRRFAKQFKQLCLATPNWVTFMQYAFSWPTSKEGIDYWRRICYN